MELEEGRNDNGSWIEFQIMSGGMDNYFKLELQDILFKVKGLIHNNI